MDNKQIVEVMKRAQECIEFNGKALLEGHRNPRTGKIDADDEKAFAEFEAMSDLIFDVARCISALEGRGEGDPPKQLYDLANKIVCGANKDKRFKPAHVPGIRAAAQHLESVWRKWAA